MAQLDDQAAVVADEPLDSAATDTTEAPRDVSLDEMYADDEPLADETTDVEPVEGEEDLDPNVNDDLPPIEAPRSWKAEEKDAFSKLPRELQGTVSRRQAEVDRFAETKAQEAAQARVQAQQEALAQVQQIAAQQAQQYQQFAAQLEPQRPSPRLMAEDPDAYADQMEAYEFYAAQRQHAQQQAQVLQQQAQYAQQQQAALEAQQTAAVLKEKLPEFYDETEGPKLRQTLGSIALDFFGYPAEELPNATANEIIGMKKVADLQAKAAKWDDLQKRKMEAVRGARNKQLPRLARPGVSTGAAQAPTTDALKLLYPND